MATDSSILAGKIPWAEGACQATGAAESDTAEQLSVRASSSPSVSKLHLGKFRSSSAGRSVVFNSLKPHGPWPARVLCP